MENETPLDAEEIAEIPQDFLDLLSLLNSFKRRPTKANRRKVVKKIVSIVGQLLVDIVD